MFYSVRARAHTQSADFVYADLKFLLFSVSEYSTLQMHSACACVLHAQRSAQVVAIHWQHVMCCALARSINVLRWK